MMVFEAATDESPEARALLRSKLAGRNEVMDAMIASLDEHLSVGAEGFSGGRRCRLGLQLDEEDVRRGVADVLAGVPLGGQPARRARLEGDVPVGVARVQSPAEGAQRVHDAVRVVVR
ncbi:MAG: hypothetical protein ACRDP6_44545, partial [Actinoallomurus sp.]